MHLEFVELLEHPLNHRGAVLGPCGAVEDAILVRLQPGHSEHQVVVGLEMIGSTVDICMRLSLLCTILPCLNQLLVQVIDLILQVLDKGLVLVDDTALDKLRDLDDLRIKLITLLTSAFPIPPPSPFWGL